MFYASAGFGFERMVGSGRESGGVSLERKYFAESGTGCGELPEEAWDAL
jgi:hypothetical protein